MTFAQTRPASRCYFPDVPPASGPVPQWIMRGANFVIAYAEFGDGDGALTRDNADEYFVYLPDSAATIEAAGETLSCPANSVAIVPPGKSRMILSSPGRALRIFSSSATDLAALALNAAVYADGADEVAPATPWPAPPGGFRLRHYKLSDYADRTMRIFRSANLMINIFDFDGPRDPEALSPHSHADFEQGSFGMSGEWVHSLRYPWSKKLSQWREDEHLAIGSPSLLVIPATVIHTSRSVAVGGNQLVDVFCPPRRDFVEMGLVCNESDYPPPAGTGA
jgi:hypothetical protein